MYDTSSLKTAEFYTLRTAVDFINRRGITKDMLQGIFCTGGTVTVLYWE